jgi:hypothetical protein
MTQGPKIFISYSSLDAGLANQLRRDLSEAGADCWLFDHSCTLGTDAWQEILGRIEDSDFYLVLVSSNSNVSSAVRQEINHALYSNINRHKPICVPLLIEKGVEVPSLLKTKAYLPYFESERSTALPRLKTQLDLDPGLFRSAALTVETKESTRQLNLKTEVKSFFFALLQNNPAIAAEYQRRAQRTRQSAGGRFNFGRVEIIEWFVPESHVRFRVVEGYREGNFMFLIKQPLVHGFHRGYSVRENILAKVFAEFREDYQSSGDNNWSLVSIRLTLRFAGFLDSVSNEAGG